MAELVVVGELNPDIVVTGVHDLRALDAVDQVEDLVEDTTVTLGSSAAITAVAAARAGASVGLVSVVGDDVLGRLCLQWAMDCGLDVGGVRTDPTTPTGSTVILVSGADRTRRRMLTCLGTMAALRVDDVDLERLPGARHLHVSSFFMHTSAREGLHEVFAAARARGVVTSLDTNDDPDATWDAGAQAMLAVTDVLFCNEREASGLAAAGGAEASSAAADALVDALFARLPVGADPRFPAVVLKLGGAGALVRTPSGSVTVEAPSTDVVDTVGAGDTLAGTVLAGLVDGADWGAALASGVAAASLSTTAVGGTTANPTPARVAELAASLRVDDGRTAEGQGPGR